jgi:hypothetical protein
MPESTINSKNGLPTAIHANKKNPELGPAKKYIEILWVEFHKKLVDTVFWESIQHSGNAAHAQ